jgi:hypothetical protein
MSQQWSFHSAVSEAMQCTKSAYNFGSCMCFGLLAQATRDEDCADLRACMLVTLPMQARSCKNLGPR